MTSFSNPFLRGNFAPLTTEFDHADLPVSGSLPPSLRGAFYRIGPNPRFAPRDNDHHWFFGDGMVHAFFIDNGRVAYRNRWVRTPKWQLEDQAGESLIGNFGNPATTHPSALEVSSGTANTNIIWHGDRLFALEEGHQPFELDPITLESKGYHDFDGHITGRFTAHPRVDPLTGELLFFAYAVDGPGTTRMLYGEMDAQGRVTRQQTFFAPFSSMAHDFLITRSHALLPVMPLTGNLARSLRGQPLYAWESRYRTHVGLIHRQDTTREVRWFDTDACHSFHMLNAWDEADGSITAWVMQSDIAPGMPMADGSRIHPSRLEARLYRWTFDLSAGTSHIGRVLVDDLVGEFPRLDERFVGSACRIAFYVCHADQRPRRGAELSLFSSLARLHLGSRQRTLYTLPDGDRLSEAVFVPRSAAAAEGDGWLLATAWRAATQLSDLLVFDAEDLAAGPVAMAHLPHRIPFGFHGNWRPAAAAGQTRAN